MDVIEPGLEFYKWTNFINEEYEDAQLMHIHNHNDLLIYTQTNNNNYYTSKNQPYLSKPILML
jgi:hypothetical protein